jgi:predicted TIM-barrel fold metal-dependent hydrolase
MGAWAAPRPRPAAPGSDVLYDTHTHLFTADTRRYPTQIRNAREGTAALMHRVATDPLEPAKLLRVWDENGVSGGVVVQYNAVYKTDNRFVLDAADTNPARFSPVVILDATDPASPETLRGFARDRGAVGLRLYGGPDAEGGYPWLDSPAALDTWAMADRLGLAMVVMYAPAKASDNALGHIARLAERFPKTIIAVDHFGWPGIEGAPDYGLGAGHLALAAHANVRFKLTSIIFNMFDAAGAPSAPFLRRAVDIYGAGRVMWGSDFGNTPGPYAHMVAQAKAAAAQLTAQERRQFLHDTGQATFARRTVPA